MFSEVKCLERLEATILMSIQNFMLSWVEQEKSFITSPSGFTWLSLCFLANAGQGFYLLLCFFFHMHDSTANMLRPFKEGMIIQI